VDIEEKMTGRWTYRVFVKWAVALAIFAILGKMVWENWNQVREASFAFRLLPFLLATFLFILSYFIQVWAWYVITLRLGIAIPIKETLVSWFYSQLGKYLPGKVWLLLTRFYFYHSKGKSKKAITVALYLETVTLVMAAGFIFLISLLFWREAEMFHFGISSQWLLVLFFLAALTLHPKVLQKTINPILMLLKREPIVISMSYPGVLWILGICVLAWSVGGIGFYLFVDSVFPVASKDFVFLTGALAISSTLGLIALFAPSGLGVREGVLVYFLSILMPGSVAVILSILSRLWMTFIEIGLIGVVYLIGEFGRKEIEKR
jgi:glycosyltransferase 2 family protein